MGFSSFFSTSRHHAWPVIVLWTKRDHDFIFYTSFDFLYVQFFFWYWWQNPGSGVLGTSVPLNHSLSKPWFWDMLFLSCLRICNLPAKSLSPHIQVMDYYYHDWPYLFILTWDITTHDSEYYFGAFFLNLYKSWSSYPTSLFLEQRPGQPLPTYPCVSMTITGGMAQPKFFFFLAKHKIVLRAFVTENHRYSVYFKLLLSLYQ